MGLNLGFIGKREVDMEEDSRQEVMIRASNNSGLTKDMLADTWYLEGLMGVYNLGLEHMLSYLEKNDKTKALTPTLWGDGYSDGELVYDMYDCPNCGKHYELYYEKYDYCPNCGQKINWEGINVD